MYGDNVEYMADEGYQHEEMEEEEDEEMQDEDADLPVDQNDSWVVIESYFATHNLVAQQVNSFNQFIENKLQARSLSDSLCVRIRLHCSRILSAWCDVASTHSK